MRISAVACTALSVFALVAEFSILLEPRKGGRVFANTVHQERMATRNGFLFQLLVFLPMFYMALCIFRTVFGLKIFQVKAFSLHFLPQNFSRKFFF
jgi:hypothetical protein